MLSLGSCDEIKLKARLVGGNPGRLSYTWSVEFKENVADAAANTALGNLNDTLSSLPADTVEYRVKANVSQIFSKPFKFVVRVSNFLDNYKDGELEVARQNNALPRAQLNERKVKAKVADIISLKGNINYM